MRFHVANGCGDAIGVGIAILLIGAVVGVSETRFLQRIKWINDRKIFLLTGQILRKQIVFPL